MSNKSPHSWLAKLVGGLALTVILMTGGCRKGDKEAPADIPIESAKERAASNAPVPKVTFTDITAASGIRFTHTSGAFGRKLLPETLGSGVAFIDFDKDGKQDLLFVNSCFWPGHAGNVRPTMAFYRNLGGGKFKDITREVGLDVTFYGMGVTVGDFDNDGWPDLFIAGVGGNHLFRNVADGKGGRKFVDVTRDAGDLAKTAPLPDAGFLDHEAPVSFPSSAAFVDYDNDGKLDLFVCNYVTWSPKIDLTQGFTLLGKGRAYGPPRAFKGTHCALYRNLGNGKFEDVTVKAGIQVFGELNEPVGKALGVIVADVDEDGWPDIIVANDTVRNFFFHNQGNGTFRERGQESGVAYAEGIPRGAMGIDWGQYRPGRSAAVIGNFANEPNTLLCLEDIPRLLFADVALIEGLAGPSRIVLKFGVFFFDFDLDGYLDLLTCNGHLEPDIHIVQASQSYKQPVQLFWNTGGKRAFEPVREEHAGSDLFKPMVGRGCAYADIDADGDLDVVLTENGGPARLLRNDNNLGHHWVRLVLEGDGRTCNTSAIGARVTLVAGGKVQKREIAAARGYLSQSELPVTFGLGKTDKIDRIEIRWPGPKGQTQTFENVPLDRVHLVRQGEKDLQAETRR